jgi:hypothetical protein
MSFVADQVSVQQDGCDTSPSTCDTLLASKPAAVHLAGVCGLLLLLLLHDWKVLVTRLVQETLNTGSCSRQLSVLLTYAHAPHYPHGPMLQCTSVLAASASVCTIIWRCWLTRVVVVSGLSVLVLEDCRCGAHNVCHTVCSSATSAMSCLPLEVRGLFCASLFVVTAECSQCTGTVALPLCLSLVPRVVGPPGRAR